jgi:NAD(P)-dependent dehydrogenase (short-subunit alcohol dehydrogenase family)
MRGRVAIVTGGASGIGRALGVELARRGAEVVLADRQLEAAREVAAEIERAGGTARAAELDVRSFDAWRALEADVAGRSGRIDYLFNNAGIGVAAEIGDYDVADWDDVIDVNLRGVAYGIQAIYPRMVRQRSGHIVNTASMAGLVGIAGQGSYAATKHAVVGLSKVLRVEAKRHGVKVSVLCPGVIRTPILAGGKFGRLKIAIDEEKMRATWERLRPIDPADLARGTLDAVDRDEAIIVLPRWWKALWYLERLSPPLSMALWERLYTRMRAELGAG